MFGTFVNIIAIIVGSTLGLFFKSLLPQRYIKIIFQVIGLFTLYLGFSMSLKSNNFLIVIFSLVLGSIIGEVLSLDKQIDKFGDFIKGKIKTNNEKFSEGLVTAFLLYCMGSMTVLGAVEEGLTGSPDLLLAKSLMDGVSSIALSSALGVGVVFSIIPLFLFQGGITLFAIFLSDFFSTVIINELTAVGGILLIGLGITVLEIKQLKIINMVPALIIVVILASIFLP
ncbi:MAG: DUF554 domain-containing protein [Bacteroidota bacterium]|nr:DUF554 domain-containing protein [Bacteroidota bacterium]